VWVLHPHNYIYMWVLAHCELGSILNQSSTDSQTFKVKEVIQPQVPLRLPCYDFVPVMNHTVVTVLRS
jgi:hypothetical protein